MTDLSGSDPAPVAASDPAVIPSSASPNKRTADRDLFVIGLIGLLALADLAALAFGHVDVHAIETLNGGVFLGLFAFLKGS